MKWTHKALIQRIFSILPYGEKLNYFAQKHITHNLPLSYEAFKKNYEAKVLTTSKIIKRYSNTDEYHTKRYFEFGAGWDLLTPIGLRKVLGLGALYVVDVRELIKAELIKDTLSKYALILQEKTSITPSKSDIKQFLADTLGIHYSLQDASNTSFAESSIDYIGSYAVLEHIPILSIKAIFKECYKILNGGGGVIIFQIDYQDHYAYFDSSISVYNFLQFSQQQWKRYNSALHYQNRLRHSDYRAMILEAGFKILEETPYYPTPQQEEILRTLPIHEDFKHYTFDDLKILGSNFVLTK